MNLLTLLIFTPLLAGTLIATFSLSVKKTEFVAMGASLITFITTLYLLTQFQAGGAIQFEQNLAWIANYGINYHLGADGYTLTIMMLIALILPATFIYMLGRSNKGMFIAMLFAQGGATGALFSLDLILFYLFWETMLLPIFIMIGLYGLKDKQRVAMRITLYTIFGSVAMLFAILVLGVFYYEANGIWSFELATLAAFHKTKELPIWIYWFFLLAFVIKVPLFAFHGWLKSAYESAPTPTLIILSGIMAKLGVYTIYRFIFVLFPQEVVATAPYVIGLGIFGMLYFGITALMQKELRVLFAYSSASHMSLIIVGLFTLNIYGQSGSLYLITAHALATAGLFLLLGILYEQSQTLTIDDHSGIIHQSPWMGLLLALFALSIVGIPGSSGFVAELLIILGSFSFSPTVGFLATTTLVVAMTFTLWLMQRILFGEVSKTTKMLKKISLKDGLTLSILAFIIYFMGLYPDPFISIFEDSLNNGITSLKGQL